MGMTDKSLCDSCTNTGCEFQSGIVRTKCAFYMPPQLEPDNCGNYVVQDSTTKNDIRDNRVKNELNRVKDKLEPITKNCESCRYYGSHHEVCNYCYKCSLWTEQEPTTKNDAVDAISRAQALKELKESAEHHANDSREEVLLRRDRDIIRALPPVTPREPRKGHWIGHREHCENLGVTPSGLGAYEWCSNCDCGIDVREWHRNHYNFCPNCGADMREGKE